MALFQVMAGAGDGVEDGVLRFAWPVGSRARVSFLQKVLREQDGSTQYGTRTRAWVWTVAAAPGQELLIRRDWDPPPTGDGMLPGVWGVQEMLDWSSLDLPVLRVGGDGRFLGIEGAASLIQRMQQALTESSLDAERRRAIADLYTEQALHRRAQDEWGMMTGVWKGRSSRPGTCFSMNGLGSFPALGLPIRLKIRGEVLEEEDERFPGSRVLLLVSEADQNDVAETLNRLGLNEAIQSLGMKREVRLVVMPHTLQPMEIRQIMDAWTDRRNGSREKEYLERIWTLNWADPRESGEQEKNRAAD